MSFSPSTLLRGFAPTKVWRSPSRRPSSIPLLRARSRPERARGSSGASKPTRWGWKLRADYSVIEGSLRPDGAALGVQRQIVGTGIASYRHDWDAPSRAASRSGALRVQRLNTGRGFWEPTGMASLAYVTEGGDAELAYAHTVTTNPLLGQTLLIDEIRLRGALPLSEWNRLALGVDGYQRGRLLDENATLSCSRRRDPRGHRRRVAGHGVTPLGRSLSALRADVGHAVFAASAQLRSEFGDGGRDATFPFGTRDAAGLPRAAPSRSNGRNRDAVEPAEGGERARPPGSGT